MGLFHQFCFVFIDVLPLREGEYANASCLFYNKFNSKKNATLLYIVRLTEIRFQFKSVNTVKCGIPLAETFSRFFSWATYPMPEQNFYISDCLGPECSEFMLVTSNIWKHETHCVLTRLLNFDWDFDWSWFQCHSCGVELTGFRKRLGTREKRYAEIYKSKVQRPVNWLSNEIYISHTLRKYSVSSVELFMIIHQLV